MRTAESRSSTVLERGIRVPFTEHGTRNTETEKGTKVRVRRAAARRAPGKTREELREAHGDAAYRVVTAYADQRIALGLPPVEAKFLAALAGQCMRLLAGGRWDEPSLLDAAIAFAGTKRFPGYFEEWASEALTTAENKAHEARKAEEKTSVQRKDKPLHGLDVSAFMRGIA